KDLRYPWRQVALLGRHVQGSPHALACSVDGTSLVSLGGEGLYCWNLEAWDIRWCRFGERPSCVAVLPNSRSLICDHGEGIRRRLIEIDLVNGETIQEVFDDSTYCWHQLTCSRDGRFLAA